MTNNKTVTFDAIRAAGGIVHSDGNIFFTNAEQFRAAAASVITPAAQSAGQEAVARYIVIGYGESDYPVAAFANDADGLLDAVLGMVYTKPTDACEDTREEYRRALADADEWCAEVWRKEFEIGGIVVYDTGERAAPVNASEPVVIRYPDACIPQKDDSSFEFAYGWNSALARFKAMNAALVNGGERAIVDAAIAWADGKPDSMKACAALVNAVASYKGERAADAQQVGDGHEGTDWMWCYENPREAASEIDRLLSLTADAQQVDVKDKVTADDVRRWAQIVGIKLADSDEVVMKLAEFAIFARAALTSPAKVPGAVMQALDRMSTPLHDSRLSGLTAELDAANIKTIRDYVLSGAVPAKVVGDDQHPDDAAVDRFSVAMKAKLAKKRAQGRGGWDDERICSPDDLARMLVDHVRKGDPVDVGNLAMMLFNRPDAGAALCRAALSADGGDRKDAERYRWLRETLHGAKAGGGVEVNDALQVYEVPTPGEEVRVYWYQDTPVGFYESHGSTLDSAIDAAIAAKAKGDAK